MPQNGKNQPKPNKNTMPKKVWNYISSTSQVRQKCKNTKFKKFWKYVTFSSGTKNNQIIYVQTGRICRIQEKTWETYSSRISGTISPKWQNPEKTWETYSSRISGTNSPHRQNTEKTWETYSSRISGTISFQTGRIQKKLEKLIVPEFLEL